VELLPLEAVAEVAAARIRDKIEETAGGLPASNPK
jgi:hypothetical protein